MKSTYEIIWTEEARLGLSGIISYIQNKFSDKEVKKFSSKLKTSLDILLVKPKTYPVSRSIKGTRRIVVGKLTSILYHINGNSIIIVSVYDNRMNSPVSNQS